MIYTVKWNEIVAIFYCYFRYFNLLLMKLVLSSFQGSLNWKEINRPLFIKLYALTVIAKQKGKPVVFKRMKYK